MSYSKTLCSKKFTRFKQDFTCVICSTLVKGNGYTNHCPSCLHSMHMDIYPGDRQNTCQGIMKPIARSQRGARKKDSILHECQACFYQRWNKTSPHDNEQAFYALIYISSN